MYAFNLFLIFLYISVANRFLRFLTILYASMYLSGRPLENKLRLKGYPPLTCFFFKTSDIDIIFKNTNTKLAIIR